MKYKNINHNFSVEEAMKYGVEEAIMLTNFRFWLAHNRANEKHIYDGRVWSYNSIKAFGELFPYWSKGQIDRILKSLIKKGILIAGNFNKTGYDRTKWYTINSEEYTVKALETDISQNQEMAQTDISRFQEMDFSISVNPFLENEKPIPDNKPYNKPDIIIKEKAIKEKVINEWNTLKEFGVPQIKALTSERLKHLMARVREYSEEEVYEAINNIKKSSFLTGKAEKKWIIKFDWFINANNFTKVLEGNYTDEIKKPILKDDKPKVSYDKDEYVKRLMEQHNREMLGDES